MSLSRLHRLARLGLWAMALLPGGAVGAGEAQGVRALLESSPTVVIATVERSTSIAGGALRVHRLRVLHTLRGLPRPVVSVVEEPRSSIPLYREGERVLAFLGPAPRHSLLRESLPEGRYLATVGGRDGVSEIEAGADEAALGILDAIARGVDGAALIPDELRAGDTRLARDGVERLERAPDLVRGLLQRQLEVVRVFLGDRRVAPEVRARLVRLLGRHEESASLLRSLRPVSGLLLAARGEALAELGHPPAIEETRAYLRHPDAEVRRFAVRQLAGTRKEDAIGRLEAVALHDPDREVRLEAVKALARSPLPAAPDALRSAFDSEDIDVQRAAARALDGLEGPEAERVLHELVFEGHSYEVQARALFVLLDRGARPEDPALQEIARRHPDPRIRRILREGFESHAPRVHR